MRLAIVLFALAMSACQTQSILEGRVSTDKAFLATYHRTECGRAAIMCVATFESSDSRIEVNRYKNFNLRLQASSNIMSATSGEYITVSLRESESLRGMISKDRRLLSVEHKNSLWEAKARSDVQFNDLVSALRIVTTEIN